MTNAAATAPVTMALREELPLRACLICWLRPADVRLECGNHSAWTGACQTERGTVTLTAVWKKVAGVLRDPRLHVSGKSVGAYRPRILCGFRDARRHVVIAQA